MKPTDVSQFIGELGAGVIEEKLAVMISQVASQVVALEKQGEVNITLKFEKFGSADQVKIKHKIVAKHPLKYGSSMTDDVRESVMCVNEQGDVTQFPENQVDMFNEKETRRAD